MQEQWERPSPLRRGIGLIMLIGALLGGILVLFGLYLSTVTLGGLQDAVNDSLASLDRTLTLTADGLDTASATLDDADVTLSALSTTLGDATQAVTDTLPTLNTVADLTGSQLPESIRSTQAALGSAQETAQIIDRVLGTISGFGLISSAAYNPEVPLNEAIATVSTSLDELPTALEQVDGGLRDASDGLAKANRDMVAVAAGVDGIVERLNEASAAVEDYREVVADLRDKLAAVRERLPPWFIGLRIGLVLAMLWLATAQISMFMHGLQLFRGDRHPVIEELDLP